MNGKQLPPEFEWQVREVQKQSQVTRRARESIPMCDYCTCSRSWGSHSTTWPGSLQRRPHQPASKASGKLSLGILQEVGTVGQTLENENVSTFAGQ